jgi:hypothetical protein
LYSGPSGNDAKLTLYEATKSCQQTVITSGIMRRANVDWGQVLFWTLLGAVGIALLSKIAESPNVNPTLRLIAQTAEGQIVQDLESEAIYLLKDGAMYLLG